MNYNKIKIIGEVREIVDPQNYTIAVKRLSETEDLIPVHVNENVPMLDIGLRVEITGQIHTHNEIEKDRSRLIICVYADGVTKSNSSKDINEVELTGHICKPSFYRTTPFNREIADMLIAVNGEKQSSYVPAIAWGRNARMVKNFEVGTEVTIQGRFQSREYEKVTDGGAETRIAYEVSISKIEVQWINATQHAIIQNQHHNYIFLTKGAVAQEWLLPQHADIFNCVYIGKTVTRQVELCGIHKSEYDFLSIEPLIEPLQIDFTDKEFTYIQQIIIGAETGNRKGKIIPRKEWISDIVKSADKAKVSVFMKESLREIMGDDFRQDKLLWEVPK
jgi:single-stranded DNA-binding protein